MRSIKLYNVLVFFSLMWSKISIKYESFWRGSLVCLGWYLLISTIVHSMLFNSYIEQMAESFPAASLNAVNYSVTSWVLSKIAYTTPLLFLGCFVARKVSGSRNFEVTSSTNSPSIIVHSILWILVLMPLIIPSILPVILEPIFLQTENPTETQLLNEVLEQTGINLEEETATLNQLMRDGKEQAENAFKKGMEYYEAKDARNAVYWLTKSAKHLSKPAFRRLIDMYSTGDLVEKDLITAGAFANIFTMLISTQEESDYVQSIHSMAMETRIDGGPNPHFEIKKKRNEIWDDDEWSGNYPQ